jgi:hypothetical protein
MASRVLLFVVAAVAAEYTCPTSPPAGVPKADCEKLNCPHVDGGAFRFVGGKEVPYKGKVTTVSSPVFDLDTQTRMTIGTLPDMQPEEAIEAVESAAAAWDRGQGVWPRMSLGERIAAIERLVEALRERRDELVAVLMWEIAKTAGDAAKEFDRTMEFVAAAIAELRKDPSVGQGFSQWEVVSGVGVRVRRGPIGVLLGLAPFNCARRCSRAAARASLLSRWRSRAAFLAAILAGAAVRRSSGRLGSAAIRSHVGTHCAASRFGHTRVDSLHARVLPVQTPSTRCTPCSSQHSSWATWPC